MYFIYDDATEGIKCKGARMQHWPQVMRKISSLINVEFVGQRSAQEFNRGWGGGSYEPFY